MSSFGTFSKLHPVPVASLRIDDAFWSPRIKTNREVTLPHQLKMIEETGRLDNLRKAAGIKEGEFEGAFFNDSDVYKWLEGASYSLATDPDPDLEAKVDEAVEAIAAAQEDDGYLNSYFTLVEPDNKWTNLRFKHELYCAGHLIEAALAHHGATGKRTLLDVARKLADHIDGIFGPEKRHGTPGTEELELALVKLYRATGEERYLRLARFFIDVRGEKLNPLVREAERDGDKGFDPQDYQAHAPVWEQKEVVGHAVRAMYLYSGMADVYAETGDKALLDALEHLWHNMVFQRMYITGGIGPTARNEGFTLDYDLPNDTAYAETCAAIGSVLWNHRMLMLTGEARFADVMETALYNGVLSGVGLDGTSFFYVNPLRNRGGHERQKWFSCACCPTNIARLIASLGGYIYAQAQDELYVNLYVGGTGSVRIGGGDVTIGQQTDYPWSGEVKITLNAPSPVEFALRLRIPGWCDRATAAVNDEPSQTGRCGQYMSIRRTWRDGDVVRLSMPMDPVRMEANPHVEEDFGKVALRRGPVVYCFEEVDNGPELFQLTLPVTAPVKAVFRKDLLGGVVALEALAEMADSSGWDDALYRKASASGAAARKVTAIPYCSWANRGNGEMIVWLNNGR